MSNCYGADFVGKRLQEFIGGGHEGEVSGVGDQDQFFLRRREAFEIVKSGLGRCNNVVLSLDYEIGGVQVAGSLRKVSSHLVWQDVLTCELHSIFKILELFRFLSLQFGCLAAQVLEPCQIGWRPQRAEMVFIEEAKVASVGWAGTTDILKLFERGLIAILPRLGQQQVVLDIERRSPACDLAGTNIGREKIWTHLHHASRDHRTPRVSEEDDLLFAKIAAEILDELDAILGDAVERHVGRDCAVAGESVAGAALVPLHDCEGFLPWSVNFGLRPLCFARTAVDNEKHGVCAVLAANTDPLIDTTKRDKRRPVDWCAGTLCFRNCNNNEKRDCNDPGPI